MSKTAFIFPGQGAQYIGMGKEFYEKTEIGKAIYETASKTTGLDIPALCFEENEKINITEYTQIAMLATSVAILKVLEEQGVKADVTAGLSLGEYGALVTAGVLSPEDAFKVIRQRGILMQEAVPTGGAMAAILGMDGKLIEEICDAVDGIVSIANYNCPGQIVITGEEKAVEEACAKMTEAGAKRTIKLNVSGPFHSKMLAEAGTKLGTVLDSVVIGDVKIPYLTNVTGNYVMDKNEIKELLMKQVSSSVRWQQSVEQMIEDGVDTFVEIGPGKTLSGFVKKINRNVKTLNIETMEDMERVINVLKGES